ncbi:hypothetical protein, partial [[Limnothrix rosea] IAM M-220]|uniref:hypothetical protein n=1 Tax=[Limnothrix rosea] IAM M-220 TaxID=454133 RepID=UPI00096476AA
WVSNGTIVSTTLLLLLQHTHSRRAEKRNYKEIIQSLNQLVNIAKDNKRNILDVVFKSLDGNKKEINAQKMGSFLKNLQNLIDSIAESAQSQEKYEFSVLSTYHGSFGIRLATPVEDQKQLNLLQGSETSLEEFIQLIQAGSESINEDAALKEELNHLSQKSIKSFKSFTGSLVELNSNVSFKLGVLDKKEDINAEMSYVRAANILEIIREKEELEKEVIDVYGKLVLAGTGKNKKERKFIFTEAADESQSYDGVISEDLLIELEYKIEAGDYYHAKIEKKTLVNTVSNSEEVKYRLCELRKIQE